MVYLFVVIQIYNKFSGFLLFFTIIYNLSLEMSDEPDLFLIAVCFAFISCNMNAKNGTEAQTQKEVTVKDHVEVLYFHGKQRCATCMAIESNTKAAMEESFAEQIKKGEVVFKVIDISKKENEKIAEKYEVTWSSLFIVKYKNGQETYENMTEFAFGNARKSPDVFKAGIVKSVNEMLK